MSRGQSGVEIGRRNVERLKAYFASLREEGRAVPSRDGRPNLSAIALACGFDRQVLYKNPQAQEVIESEFGDRQPAAEPPADGEKPQVPQSADRRDRRIHQLEQENAAMRAELVGLRERLRRLAHIERHMVQTGRGVMRSFDGFENL